MSGNQLHQEQYCWKYLLELLLLSFGSLFCGILSSFVSVLGGSVSKIKPLMSTTKKFMTLLTSELKILNLNHLSPIKREVTMQCHPSLPTNHNNIIIGITHNFLLVISIYIICSYQSFALFFIMSGIQWLKVVIELLIHSKFNFSSCIFLFPKIFSYFQSCTFLKFNTSDSWYWMHAAYRYSWIRQCLGI